MLDRRSAHLQPPCDAVKATPIFAYVDVVRVWLRHPLTTGERRWVNRQVGNPLRKYPFNIRRGTWQRLILTQPSEACLQFFAKRDDARINYVELALDLITPHARQLKQECVAGFMQRWHRNKRRMVRFR